MLLTSLGVPALTVTATLARYRHTAALQDAAAGEDDHLAPDADGISAQRWLLAAERRHSESVGSRQTWPGRLEDLAAMPALSRLPSLAQEPSRCPTCLPPLTPEPPQRLRVPPGAWDTHAHVIGNPLLHPFARLRHVDAPKCPAATLVALLDRLGLAHGLAVQASVHGTNNRLPVETLRRHPDRLRGVAVIDDRTSEIELVGLADAGVRGVRILDIVGGGVGFASLERQGAICAEMAWHVQLGLKGDNFPVQAGRITALPVPVVIDHMGWCPAAEGLQTAAFKAVKKLVRDHGCWVKLSGAFRLSSEGPPWADTRAVARALAEVAPNRLLWGSDWPHVGLYDAERRPDSGALLDWLADKFPEAAMQTRILVENPAALYGLPGVSTLTQDVGLVARPPQTGSDPS